MINFEAKFHEQERELNRFRSSLENLAHYGSKQIKEALANEGLMLDILVNDEHWEVREMVAYQGFGLPKLSKDVNKAVREAAREMLNQ